MPFPLLIDDQVPPMRVNTHRWLKITALAGNLRRVGQKFEPCDQSLVIPVGLRLAMGNIAVFVDLLEV